MKYLTSSMESTLPTVDDILLREPLVYSKNVDVLSSSPEPCDAATITGIDIGTLPKCTSKFKLYVPSKQ